jgi:hypothetical protein
MPSKCVKCLTKITRTEEISCSRCEDIWHFQCAFTGLSKPEFITFKQTCVNIKRGISNFNINIICKKCDVIEVLSQSINIEETTINTPNKFFTDTSKCHSTPLPSAPILSFSHVLSQKTPSAPTLSQITKETSVNDTVINIEDEENPILDHHTSPEIKPNNEMTTNKNSNLLRLETSSDKKHKPINEEEIKNISKPKTVPFTKTKKACWAFNAGNCLLPDCNRHHFVNICPKLEMYGKCKNGPTCLYEHPYLCKYQEKRRCKYDNYSCSYFHKREASKPILKNNNIKDIEEQNTCNFLGKAPELRKEIVELISDTIKKQYMPPYQANSYKLNNTYQAHPRRIYQNNTYHDTKQKRNTYNQYQNRIYHTKTYQNQRYQNTNSNINKYHQNQNNYANQNQNSRHQNIHHYQRPYRHL